MEPIQHQFPQLRQQVQQENHEHWLLEAQASTSASSRGPTPEPFPSTQETNRLDSEPFQLLYGHPVRELPDSVFLQRWSPKRSHHRSGHQYYF